MLVLAIDNPANSRRQSDGKTLHADLDGASGLEIAAAAAANIEHSSLSRWHGPTQRTRLICLQSRK